MPLPRLTGRRRLVDLIVRGTIVRALSLLDASCQFHCLHSYVVLRWETLSGLVRNNTVFFFFNWLTTCEWHCFLDCLTVIPTLFIYLFLFGGCPWHHFLDCLTATLISLIHRLMQFYVLFQGLSNGKQGLTCAQLTVQVRPFSLKKGNFPTSKYLRSR